jgi:hypothetical protein
MSKDIVDTAAALAEQQAAYEAWRHDLETVTSVEEIGTWFPPAELRGCVFLRCGVRAPDGSMPPACAKVYHAQKAMGARDAPKGMRPPVGFERDDTRGVYVYFFPQIWHNIQLAKRAVLKRQKDPMRKFQDQVGPGVEIDVRPGTFTPNKRK